MIGILEFALASDQKYRSFTEQIIKVGYLSKTKKGDESCYTLAATENLIMLEHGFGYPRIIRVNIGWSKSLQGTLWQKKSKEASLELEAFADIFVAIDSSTSEEAYVMGKIK